jgi:hypothetical protein
VKDPRYMQNKKNSIIYLVMTGNILFWLSEYENLFRRNCVSIHLIREDKSILVESKLPKIG